MNKPTPERRPPQPAPVGARPVRLAFGPDLRPLVITVPGAVLAAVAAAVADDPVQRFFSIVVALVLVAVTAAELVFRPRLVVTADGLRVNGPFDRAVLPWASIVTVQASTSQRYGLRSHVLEIDAGERLVVLDRRDLAADPWAVARAITDFRPAG